MKGEGKRERYNRWERSCVGALSGFAELIKMWLAERCNISLKKSIVLVQFLHVQYPEVSVNKSVCRLKHCEKGVKSMQYSVNHQSTQPTDM